ncbi:unnamed protein product [Closterium sp. NIES-54]
MDVARTSMIHAAAPHFLWSFAVQYAAHQLNLQPRVSVPETSPTLLWTGKVGDASVFWVWGSRAFVRDLSADKLSPRGFPCVFLGFPLDAPGWHRVLSSRRVLSSQDVTFDESVPYYHLFPYHTAPLPPPPLFLAPGPPPFETSAVAEGAARGTPRPPFFEGCSPSPLAADVSNAEDVGAASASVKRHSSKGKGGRDSGGGSGGGGGGSGSGGGGSSGGSGGGGGSNGGGTGGGSGGSGGGCGGSGGSGGSGGGGTGGGRMDLGVEALVVRGTSGGSDSCPYVIHTGVRAGHTCGKLHTQHRCFSRLDVAWRAEFGDDVERPCLADLLRSRVAIFDLDYDAILFAMYALSASAEGDCYWCVSPDPGIAAGDLGASESGTLPSTALAVALHTFTLDLGASRCFFRDSTTRTPLPAPVLVRMADPSGGPVVARSSTFLPCPAVPSGSLSGLHPPSFSTNLVSTAALQDAMVTTTTLRGQRVSICTCTRTGRHLDTFTRRPGSSLYTLATEPPQVAASTKVSASGQVAASCSCRLLSHETLLWHHRLGHPSLPRLRGTHSRLLVSGLPRSLPPLPTSPALPCLPCVEWRQRAAPHSSFPPTTAPLQTLHMDVKGEVVDVLIPWIRTVRLQLRERFRQDLPVLRLHSDKGGEFPSDLLREFCRGEGILQSFTLPDSSQQNGIAERRIGLGMEVARTSMIHAAAPHFLWPFTGEVGDASVFRVWGSLAFVCSTFADKLSARAILCVFLGFVPDAPGWRFYHPTSRCVHPSQDVMFDKSVPFHRLFPHRFGHPPPPPLFLAPGPPPVDPLPPQGPAPSGVSQVDPLPNSAPVQVADGSGAPLGAASGGAEPGDAEFEGGGHGVAEPAGVEPGGVEPGVDESEGAESGGAEPRGAASSGGPAGASPRLSPQQLREWLVRRARLWSGAPGAGGARDVGAGGAGVTTGAGGPRGSAAAGPRGARTRGSCAGGAGAGGAGAEGAGVGGTGAGGAGAASVVSLRLILSHLFCTARRVPRAHPPPVPSTHAMALRPSSVLLRVPLPAPPESSQPDVPDPASDRARAARPTVSCLLATALSDPSFESATASSLVAELLGFAAACHLDYATALVVESASASPPSVGGECALGTDVPEDRQEDFECLAAAVPRFASMLLAPEGDPDAPDIPTPRSYAEAITSPYSSHWQAAMDVEMASWKSTGTYVDEVPPLGANIVDGMWIFKEKRPPGSPPAFKARSVALGFNQRQRAPREWHDTLRNTLVALGFAPSTADPSLFLRTDTSLPQFYVLVYVHDLVFANADTEALTFVKSELQKRHTCTDLAPPSDESIEPSGPYPELVGCLMYLVTCTRPDLVYLLSLLARYVAPGRHRKVHWDAGKRVLRYLCSTLGMGLVLGGRGPVVLTGHADASWVDDSATQQSSQGYTFSLGATLGEQPRSPPVLYVDNKATIALCQEHILEDRMKHIALRYFLARELQLGGQLCLVYVATRANTADVFTKAFPPGDHLRFSTVLGLVPTLPHLLTA